jgi:hypothetical protein
LLFVTAVFLLCCEGCRNGSGKRCCYLCYSQAAIKQAEKLQLAQHEIWLALLHYKRETVLGRFISQADDAVAGFDLDKK